MTPAERTQIIEREEARIAEAEQARDLNKARIEQLHRDFRALFVEHQSGPRVLAALEEMFGQEPTSAQLLKMTGENAKAALAKCAGARQVVGYCRRIAIGAIEVKEARRRRSA